jgi:hypothetical protein
VPPAPIRVPCQRALALRALINILYLTNKLLFMFAGGYFKLSSIILLFNFSRFTG